MEIKMGHILNEIEWKPNENEINKTKFIVISLDTDKKIIYGIPINYGYKHNQIDMLINDYKFSENQKSIGISEYFIEIQKSKIQKTKWKIMILKA